MVLHQYTPQEHFALTLTFLAVFFGIFYGMRLAELRLFGEDDNGEENWIASSLTAVLFYAMCFGVVMRSALLEPQYWTLFSYVTVISLGIIGASLRFYPPVTVYGVLLAKWVIFCGWFASAYTHAEYIDLTLVFLGLFFAISYATTIVRSRSLEDENEKLGNIAAGLLSGLAFYFFCFVIINDPVVEANRYWLLFGYLAGASVAVLATSFRFFGRVFMYLVVPACWAIYASWFFTRFDQSLHFDLAAVFAGLFFATFYFSILFHRVVQDNFTLVEHTSLILLNAFTFFGFGYALLDSREALQPYQGIYTFANGVLHLAVALAIRALKPKAVDAVQVLTVLVLTFGSLAVPVQFDGNLVTMIWAAEGAVLFWYGRARAVPLFEKFAVPVLALATISLGLEWVNISIQHVNGTAAAVTPFINADFVTAIVYATAFALVFFTNRNKNLTAPFDADLVRGFGMIVAAALFVAVYNIFRMEISNYFYSAAKQFDIAGGSLTGARGDLNTFSGAWQIDYTMVFLTALAAFNLKKLRSASLGLANVTLACLALGAFSVFSMFLFHELRITYMAGSFDPDFISHWLYIGIRPISYLLAGGLLLMLYRYSRDPLMDGRGSDEFRKLGFDAVAYTLTFIVASCELINLMGQLGLPDATKLGLSILWGIYALAMVVIGIAWDKKHLRIAAMTLLALTLVKLFFYDIAELDTIPKTILFVTLGITLLVVSFLYNKYKNVIFKSETVQDDGPSVN